MLNASVAQRFGWGFVIRRQPGFGRRASGVAQAGDEGPFQIGRAVLGQVIAACEALGLRQMVALIGDSRNAGSVGIHTALGFTHGGVMSGVGFKAGRWLDVVIMQRALNGGADGEPDAAGLILGGV